jgi:ATP-binding cassette subfamily C (CFTR/MRP) protein 1
MPGQLTFDDDGVAASAAAVPSPSPPAGSAVVVIAADDDGGGGGGKDSSPPPPPDHSGGNGPNFEEEKKVDVPDDRTMISSTTTVIMKVEEVDEGRSHSHAKEEDDNVAVAAKRRLGAETAAAGVYDENDDREDDDIDLLLSNEDKASCLSRWLILYMTPLLKLGATKVLEPNDVGPPSKCDRAGPCHESVRNLWLAEVMRVRKYNEVERAAHCARIAKLPTNATARQWKRAGGRTYRPRTPNLAKVLWNAFGYWRVWYAIALYVLSALLQFMPVLILTDLVRYFEANSRGVEGYDALLFNQWGNVVGLFIFPMIVSLLQTRSQIILNHCSIYIRTSVSTLLFSKALTISASGRAETSTGQVVNMMSNDTQQLQRFLQFFGFTLVAPIQIVISLILIYRQVGNATWVGIAFMICLIPVNVVVFSKVSTMRRRVLKYSDARVKMINEILTGIRIIKFYAWEGPFQKEVHRLREKELKALTTLAYTTAIGFSLIMLSAPIINPMLVFLAYIHTSDVGLDAATAFTTIALFNIMRFPFAFLPMGFLQLVQSLIALRRLSKYLVLSELNSYVVPSLPESVDDKALGNGADRCNDVDDCDRGAFLIEDEMPSDPVVIINDGTFSWIDPDALPAPAEPTKKKRMSRKEKRESMRKLKEEKESKASTKMGDGDGSKHPSTNSLNRAESMASLGISIGDTLDEEKDNAESRVALKNITCSIERGSLVAVVGPVGSGKSSFLAAILGEMESIGGTKVYMSLQSEGETRRDNLVSYCSQTPWVVNDTLRGNILFGRTYHEARYESVVRACALADDLAVLPAGDMTEIGERGINLSGGQKARVSLARAMYSPDSRLILMDDPLSAVDAHVGEHLFLEAITGDICKGATRVLVTHHVHFLPRCDAVIVLEKGMIKHAGTFHDLVSRGVDFAGAVDIAKKDDAGIEGDDTAKKSANDDVATVEKSGVGDINEKGDDATNQQKMKKAGEKLVQDEEQNEGSVEGSMYTHYCKAGGTMAFVSIFVIQAIGKASEVMSSFWISFWAGATAKAGANQTTVNTIWYLNIFCAFSMGGVLCLTFRSLAMAVHRLKASKKLHEGLTQSILRAPVAFFDVTPVGRVLNRFAADMDKIDLELTQSLGQAVSTIFSMIGAVAAIVAATKGTLLVPLLPIGYLNYVVQKWFRKSSTELQRCASVAASPLFTDFSQMLSGTSTIRAYGKQTRFFKNCRHSFDQFNALYSAVQQANFWLGLRLDVLGGSIGMIIGGIALATKDYNFIPAGWVGLALAYSIEVTGYLKHGVRMIAQVEAEMNSVERVMFYTDNVESEAATETDLDPKSSEWPSRGEIRIQNASLRYRDGPLVLKNISVSIQAGEKIGVVGRTGSGKSSLMSALFRITEIESDGGKIFIDGLDVSTIVSFFYSIHVFIRFSHRKLPTRFCIFLVPGS